MMRIGVFTAMVMATTILSGCNSAGLGDALDISSTSKQTTGSIASGPVPAEGVSDSEAAALVAEPQPVAGTAIETAMVRTDPVPASSGRTSRAGRFSDFKVYPPRFDDAHPVNFGDRSPHHFAVHGVDVSRWQGPIDWHKLRKQGANFAYIKATEGGDHLDPNFHENWKGAAEAGIPRGAYHFFYWCRIASEQADWFIRNVPKEKGALPPVIDVEWNAYSRSCPKRPPRETVLKKMRVFIDMVEKHYGQKPVIYTAPDFYEDNLKGQFKEYSFWLRSVAAHPGKRYPGREFAFWQYSGTGLSANHPTKIDLNVFNGSKDSWRRWLNQRVH